MEKSVSIFSFFSFYFSRYLASTSYLQRIDVLTIEADKALQLLQIPQQYSDCSAFRLPTQSAHPRTGQRPTFPFYVPSTKQIRVQLKIFLPSSGGAEHCDGTLKIIAKDRIRGVCDLNWMFD